MCRLFFFTVILLSISFSFEAEAQDIIVKQNGERIKTKVVQVSDTLVKYKNFDDPEFVTYDMQDSDIRMIIFENGKKKIFGIDLARSYVAISWGSVQPVGDFRKYGLAKTGKGGSIDGCFYIKNKKWGVGFEAASFKSEIESSSLENNLRNNLSGNEQVTMSFGDYSGGWLAAGPQYSSKMNRWITWDIRGAIGLISLSNPSFDYLYSDGGNINVHFKSNKGTGMSLMRSVSSGFRFNITPKFALKLGFRIAGSNTVVKYGTEFSQTDSMGNIVASGHINDNKKLVQFGSFSGTFGLVYNFGEDRIKPDLRKMYKKYPPSYLEVIYGPSLPIGIYDSDDYSKNDAGLAKPGNHVNIDGCIYLKNRKWGLGFDIAAFDNKFEYEEVDNYLLRNISVNEKVTTSYGKYSGQWLSAGPQFSSKIRRWLLWDLRYSVGIMGFSKPSLDYTYVDASNNKLEYKLDHGFGSGLLKSFTSGFRCYLTDKLALRLFVQFASGKPVVKFNQSVVQTNSSGTVTFSDSQDKKKQVYFATVNTGFGLSYQFGRK